MKPINPQENEIETAPTKRTYKSPNLRVYGGVKALTETSLGTFQWDGFGYEPNQPPPMTGL